MGSDKVLGVLPSETELPYPPLSVVVHACNRAAVRRKRRIMTLEPAYATQFEASLSHMRPY